MAGGHSLNIKQGPGPRSSHHPRRIRSGQMFFPLEGRRRMRLMVRRLDGEWVRVVREDGSETSLPLDRLLARNEAGDGRHYSFHGWKRRPRGYRTELQAIGFTADLDGFLVCLPEWDPDTEIELSLASLPEELRVAGAVGSCMANLASTSAAGLDIHMCAHSPVRGRSREALSAYPDSVAEGQEYRRRRDGARFRLLDCEPQSQHVRAWGRGRVVNLSVDRLLAIGADGDGVDYVYLGGGVAANRRQRALRGDRRSI